LYSVGTPSTDVNSLSHIAIFFLIFLHGILLPEVQYCKQTSLLVASYGDGHLINTVLIITASCRRLCIMKGQPGW
jgi:hypothetical protein